MKKILFIFFSLFFISLTITAQIRKLDGGFGGGGFGGSGISNDSLNSNEKKVKLSGKTKYTDYRIFSQKNDTVYIDTTLTIKKEYQFNFLRKDNFELLAFHNQGQTFNSLGYTFANLAILPSIGFTAKNFNFLEIDDVKYYQVPTPTTRMMYRTGLEQGQVLEALFTLNFSKRFNIALTYKGIRSLGHYRRSLASQGNFIASFHYETKEGQYEIKGHTTMQDLNNQESGGLTEDSLENFITDNEDTASERGRLDVNLTSAENLLDGKRYYFEHTYKLLSSKDSLKEKEFSNLKIGQAVLIENKFYKYTEDAFTEAVFGSAYVSGEVNNTVKYDLFDNQFFIDFNSKYVLGKFRVKTNYTSYEYGYDELINNTISSPLSKNRLKGKGISFGADWNAKIKSFQLNASAKITPGSARLSGSDFRAEALYKKDSLFTIKGRLLINSKSPNFNYLLHQSNYIAYNWENNFSNVGTRNIGGTFDSKWGSASLDVSNISNYTYFDSENKPQQTSENINYLKLKVSKEFTLGKFALNNTLLYQKASNGSAFLRVPDFVTRNTLYYSDSWFKGSPLLVQIGATFKYFTTYKANAYNPLLSEFTLQDETDIGFPTFDVFFNARVRRTRIYFKIDNVTSSISKKNYLSAPTYPYRDFSIRFGVVWNWFI